MQGIEQFRRLELGWYANEKVFVYFSGLDFFFVKIRSKDGRAMRSVYYRLQHGRKLYTEANLRFQRKQVAFIEHIKLPH